MCCAAVSLVRGAPTITPTTTNSATPYTKTTKSSTPPPTSLDAQPNTTIPTTTFPVVTSPTPVPTSPPTSNSTQDAQPTSSAPGDNGEDQSIAGEEAARDDTGSGGGGGGGQKSEKKKGVGALVAVPILLASTPSSYPPISLPAQPSLDG
jgi:hypothetical protein